MSREELVGDYVKGNLSRRVFIRSLVALGVSAAAAVTYADSLSATTPTKAPSAAAINDLYPDDTTTTSSTSTSTSTTSSTSSSTTAGAGVAADQTGRSGAAAPVHVDPTFTG
jgi:hypothetical protein